MESGFIFIVTPPTEQQPITLFPPIQIVLRSVSVTAPHRHYRTTVISAQHPFYRHLHLQFTTTIFIQPSTSPHFPFHLLLISTGGENQGQKIAAATYLKNHTRRNVDSSGATPSNVSKEFKDQLMQALLQVEFTVLKILVEVFRVVVAADFVKQSLWPDLVPNLQSAIQNSHLINGSNSTWNTINALIVLHALIRPFQYFLNPKIAKEPVPPQLELIAKEILVPLLTLFHEFFGKVIANHDSADIETEKTILSPLQTHPFDSDEAFSDQNRVLRVRLLSVTIKTQLTQHRQPLFPTIQPPSHHMHQAASGNYWSLFRNPQAEQPHLTPPDSAPSHTVDTPSTSDADLPLSNNFCSHCAAVCNVGFPPCSSLLASTSAMFW